MKVQCLPVCILLIYVLVTIHGHWGVNTRERLKYFLAKLAILEKFVIEYAIKREN